MIMCGLWQKKDNDVNDCIGAVYTEIEIEL